ncbi:MAG: 3-alpha-hydroxysteroid dehydrogenase [Actinomycetia bacterium]|nr:3-alpha-hydroxysteroid dehydrogenase [Actinomycetes bacterium]
MGRLDGKVALVSGGARGQGEAEVRLFVAEGASVVFGDVLDDLGELVAKDLGPAASYIHLDVRAEEDWDAAVGEAEARYGRLDVLVNNAGVLDLGTLTHETPVEQYRRVIEINQFGVFLGMRSAIPALLRGGGGSIVNTSSTNGIAGYGGSAAYTASKFAVRGMTKNAALEYGKAGIRVNSIHPGPIATPMTQPDELGGFDEAHQAEAFDRLPLARVGQPEEVAKLVLFLASDDSSYCTGGEYLVDGGMLAGVVNPHARA